MRGKLLGFWSWSYKRPKNNYISVEQEVQAADEDILYDTELLGTEQPLWLYPRLPVLIFLFKDSKPAGGRATSATWQKCVLAFNQ